MTKPIPFGKYYLLERINVGGMAEVFKGKAFGVEGFERLVAVKRILPNIAEDEEFITMFIDEAKIAVQLQHANIAQIFDLGKVDDSYFIALEYVYGKDLRAIFDHLNRIESSMPTAQACFIIMQVCEGLDYAHQKRDQQGRELHLVHRDVSPQNVLIGYEGEIKLVDFGIAKAAGKASKTQAGILKGKFGYMSPEQVRGLPVDRRSDIFALGIILYELLTEERLFVGESDFSTLEKVRNVEILPPSSFNKKIPAELERITLKALAKDVEDRYQNAIDLHDDLQAFLYSVGDFYSRKDLAAWMKKTFAEDLAEENAKLEQYQQYDRLDEPTPAPPRSGSNVAPVRGERLAASASRPAGSESLEWDDEELETQIFDKAADELEGAQLDSSDILLQEEGSFGLGDDKTVAGAPPAELLHEAELGRAAMQARAGQGGGGGASARPGGPPPGISAFRHPTSSTDGYYLGGGQARPFDGGGAAAQHAFDDGRHPGYDSQRSSNFRQTLSGMPVSPLAGPLQGAPDRKPLEHLASRRGSRAPFMMLLLVLLGGAGFLGWRYVNRPGKLLLMVKPVDALITIDGAPVKGTPPLTVERPPGQFQLSVERDGYVRKDQSLDFQAGQSERLEVELEPSPDTGFELTSEPPGGLVWLDGQPFTSGEDNAQQARTNFRAYRVAPGRHVIEIRGDSRYDDWKQEFFQEPGKTHKLHAALRMRGAGGSPAASGAGPVARPWGATVAPAPSPPARAAPPATGASAAAAESPPTTTSSARPAAAPSSPPAAAVVKTPEPPRTQPEPPRAVEPPVARSRPPRTASPRPASPPRAPKGGGGEDVFEQETKLGSAAAAATPPAGGAGGEECQITLGSKPWSEVWIDGKNTGKVTPMVDHKLPCGRHRVRFWNPELKAERNETITVKAGEKFKKMFPLVDTNE